MCTGSFSGVKQLLHGVNPPPSSSAEVKEGVGVHLYFPMCAFMAGYSVNFTLTFTLEIPHLKKFITKYVMIPNYDDIPFYVCNHCLNNGLGLFPKLDA